MAKIFIFLIRVYSGVISPFTMRACRFHPTCSAYATEAITRHGAWKGAGLAVRRLSRCHPWNKAASYHDPVPD